jgi:hypothetical protein
MGFALILSRFLLFAGVGHIASIWPRSKDKKLPKARKDHVKKLGIGSWQ